MLERVRKNMVEYRLTTPIDADEIKRLRVGDIIYISGTVFTARDEAHMHMLDHGKIDGVQTEGSALYHCGPLMKKVEEKWTTVSAGPTTSARMNSLEVEFLKRFGPRVIIGKGGMNDTVASGLKEYGAVYAAFTGGAGALGAEQLDVKSVHLLEELGMAEAVWVFEAKEFGPLVVAMDSEGNSLYRTVDLNSRDKLNNILKE